MTFLNPLFLFGLAAAAIPLIIHLFNFRRPRKIDFSSLTFIKELEKSTMQRVRIKQWLLLLLRTLAIACLVLAFARPTLTGSMVGALGARATSAIAIVIDNSRSMALRDSRGAYLDQALNLADGILEVSSQGDEVYLLPVAGPTDAEGESFEVKSLAREAIRSIAIQPAAIPLNERIEQATQWLAASEHLNKELYLLTDLQQHTFLDSIKIDSLSGLRTYLVPVGDRAYSNIAITEVEVLSRIIEVGQPARISATIVNYSDEPVEGYVVSAFLDEERLAQSPVNLDPGIPRTVTLSVSPRQTGWQNGVISIEDDDFDSDNAYHFVLHVPETRSILLVQGEDTQTDFMELALSPALVDGRVAFDTNIIPETSLAATALSPYDAVILQGVRTLSSGEIATLEQYVAEGGGVLFFPAAGAQAQEYNAFFESVGGGSFSGFSGTLAAPDPFTSFDRIDLEHPLFEGMFDRGAENEAIRVEQPAIYHAMNYAAGNGTEQSLIQLSNGFSFLQEIRYGRGGAFVMAVLPDPAWSDLPRRGLFIPLVYRCIFYLSSRATDASSVFTVGEPGELRLAGVPETAILRLVSPEGEDFVPEQRNLFGASLLQLPRDIARAGHYPVFQGDEQVHKIAYNLDSAESNLATFSADEALNLLQDQLPGSARLLDVASSGNVQPLVQSLEEERSGIELWNLFLLLALITLIAEMLVARQWKPETVAA